MPLELHHDAFIAITTILLIGTISSVWNESYLDTSNPLLTHLPHPLHKTHYFASKTNLLNVWFIKRAWGWTSLAFILLWGTSPRQQRTARRAIKWISETLVWMMFTSWFFGPAILERVIAASGGECIVSLPTGDILTVPVEYCFTKATLSPETHPGFFSSGLLLPDATWRGVPRLRRGHDVSGHVFILTMAVLFLVDQLRSSPRTSTWTWSHRAAVTFNVVLISIWLFSLYTTSIYFHSPIEKFSGYLLGLAGFAVTQVNIA
ncbi:Fat storage-inducing transmembrane protein [Hygrophoropsis aurantiaca]|uniref:Fat storage-inducing transmembrane protein n=1 Tax=Hygrophoropsis aurantiaca TaxID=72124 RepID=A0ACB8AJC8_9AGAM|nr:Fat storage-inducing transmembrane protein [Hygrophoropsis aurantiaca]